MTLKEKLKTEPTRYPPPHLLQRISNNPDLADFLSSSDQLRGTVKRYLAEAGLEFSQFRDILDFGCGVGRFFFAFEQELGADQRVWGCDVFEECAQWCHDNIDFAEIAHTSTEPPLPYRNEQFDLVYGLSVFTHLKLELQFKWAWELHRILRPGGVIFATTHGKLFIPLFYQAYLDGAQRRELYSLGEKALFAYMSYSGSPDDEGQVSVAAAQTIGFVKEQFSAFEFIRAFPQSDLAGEQDLYIIRKPSHGRAVALPLSSDTGEATKQCTWIGKIATPTSSEPLSLRFNLDRHGTFHVYPKINVPAILMLDCQIDLRTGDGSLLSKRVPLNIQRLFGPSHYAVIELEVPEYSGEIVVDLLCLPRQPSAVGQSGVEEVEWNFPNFT